MLNAKLLEVRNAAKRRKPNFQIQNSNDPKKRFAGRWKRPKGLQNKMRERRKGNPRYIEPGYGSPVAVKGTTAEGLFPIVVRNVADLEKVRADHGVIISAAVSMKKKAQIAKVAVERKLKLLNFNAEEMAKKLSEGMASRKTRRLAILQKRKVKAEVKKPAAVEKKEAQPAAGDIESKVDEEAKKKAEKAEKDKVLTTKAM